MKRSLLLLFFNNFKLLRITQNNKDKMNYGLIRILVILYAAELLRSYLIHNSCYLCYSVLFCVICH